MSKELHVPLKERYYFLDNLKSFLVLLMIVDHVSVAYMPIEGFPYVPSNASDWVPELWPVVCISASFIMGVFYFISGYFFPLSYDRNGSWKFLKNKFVRLAVPFFFIVAANRIYLGRFEIYQLWYIECLLFLSVIYVLIRCFYTIKPRICKYEPSIVVLLLIGILVGLGTFLVRQYFSYAAYLNFKNLIIIEPAHYVQYLSMFVFGVISYRYRLIYNLQSYKMGVVLITIAFFVMLWFLNYSGENCVKYLNSRMFSVIESVFCVFMVVGLIIVFKQFCNKTNMFLKWCSQQSYGAYLIHNVFLVIMAYALDDGKIHVVYKYTIVLIMTIFLSFFVAWLLRRIPVIREVI